ncbi:MAG: flagellar hook-basal body complex protein, partial [Sedimentisphaerales bacterium]|nr:flagellar hook-basal body complex protein [Sedimentisphaerales bacterium]
NGNAAQTIAKISDLEQFSGDFAAGETGTITITGTQRDSTAIDTGNTLAVDADTTLGDLVTKINSLLIDSIASLGEDGRIKIVDKASGYSKTDLNMAYTPSTGGTDALESPGYFEITTAGGDEVKNVNMTVVDSLGGKHTINAAFVRTNTRYTWDMVLTSMTGEISALPDRRIEGITFSSTGAYNGLADINESASFGIKFAQDAGVTQTIGVSLGMVGGFDGITQFSGSSTAVVNGQDGYEAGRLSTLSVNSEGTVVGAFSNGIKKDIASIQVALFKNSAGLESSGNGTFVSSANSGEAVATQALNGGAGAIHGSSLEKSNVDVATEFVAMIEAQNGYQANARTISVASSILSTLTNLIR